MGISSAAAPHRYSIGNVEVVICSAPMCKLMRMAERVARSGAAVLITGETGVGKELVARAIHHYSFRSAKPWVDLNCATLPENLVESELFGYEKGAFSGADTAKPGLFELADRGTLFLDEIGELEPRIQVKLLRVLDGAPYYRLGGNRKITVDVRIIAATNQEIERATRTGQFRSDLYHRLAQFQLRVPPLRERPEDVAALAEHFLHQQNPGARFTEDAVQALRCYPWPGNVRELRNVVLQAATLTESPRIGATDLMLEAEENGLDRPGADTGVTDLHQLERRAIEDTLEQTGGHRSRAAGLLGISRRTLSRKLKQYQVDADAPGRGLGSMSPSQHQYFRAAVEAPVFVCNSKGDELKAKLVNVSSRGIAIAGIDNPLKYPGVLQIEFVLPGSDVLIRAAGRMVWADLQGKGGIQLTQIPPDGQRELTRWLEQKRQEEGWAAV